MTTLGATLLTRQLRKEQRQAGTSSQKVERSGYWSPLTTGDEAAPELIYAGGDVVMVWKPTP